MANKREQSDTPEPIIAAFRPESASPDDVERLIDYRIDRIDEEITQHMATVEELRGERKRWLGVTGGRSRGNGQEEAPSGPRDRPPA